MHTKLLLFLLFILQSHISTTSGSEFYEQSLFGNNTSSVTGFQSEDKIKEKNILSSKQPQLNKTFRNSATDITVLQIVNVGEVQEDTFRCSTFSQPSLLRNSSLDKNTKRLSKTTRPQVYFSEVSYVHEEYNKVTPKLAQSKMLQNYSDIIHSKVVHFNDEDIVFRVRKGTPAKIGEFPYQVALMKSLSRRRRGRYDREGSTGGAYQAFCGGSIISRTKVLTAAHCVVTRKLCNCYKGQLYKSDFKRDVIVAGQLKTRAYYGVEGQWRRIKKGRYPRDYRFPKSDIAVLDTMSPFQFTQMVNSIVYARRTIDYPKITCIASGYGLTERQSQSPILLYARLDTITMAQCRKVHRQNFDKFVCTSDENADVDKGDSGGPLVCKGTGDPDEIKSPKGILVGVVSGKAIYKKWGTFFTRVSTWSKFIGSGLSNPKSYSNLSTQHHETHSVQCFVFCYILYIFLS